MRHLPLSLLSAALALLTLALPARPADDVVPAGAGGYLLTRPEKCRPLPDRVYRSDHLTGPTLTGQWWSSLVWQKYSQAMHAHPLLMRCTPEGLAVSYQGAQTVGNGAGIFGGNPADSDFTIGHSGSNKFPEALCSAFSDWFVSAQFTDGQYALTASFGHGSPYVYFDYSAGNPKLTFAAPPKIFAGTAKDPVLGITVNNHHYALFGATGTTWDGLDSKTFTNLAGKKDYFSIALLPNDKPETLALFTKYAYNHVTNTQANFKIENGSVKSTYTFTVKTCEGTEKETLYALYPHQWKYSADKLTDLTYNSVRGTMKVAVGTGFSTTLPIQGVLPMLPKEGIQDQARMLAYVKEAVEKVQALKPDEYKDTYWGGKDLGMMATMSGIAEQLNQPDLQKIFLDEIKRRLEMWFTAVPGKQEAVFYYNPTWGTLVGCLPSYGSDAIINDHHFHYGYFIRAAAEVARTDPAWAKKWGPMVNILIRDIASPDRNDKLFPYVRCFDKYAGHSWASGNADNPDGNNQESSSESMNAWYAVTLWGQATGDTATRDMGLYLFNTERTAIEEYWFDVSNTNFPKGYPNAAVGMVWGGKGDFGTYFGRDTDFVHGINWLPFTPASLYLGRHPDYVKKNVESLLAKRPHKGFNEGWGDLICMYNALQNPDESAAFIDATPDCNLEAGNSHAFMYHWIYTLKNLGLVDASLTADYPLTAVFTKSNTKTYAAYNYLDQPLTITFSDGKKLTAKSHALTVEKAN